MDKEFLEKNLMAYLDGQLFPSELAEFERELAKYPDLLAEVARMKKLEAIAKRSKAELPSEEYFEMLAAKIDDRITSLPKPTVAKPVKPRRNETAKVIRIVTSIAAVLLIVLVVNQIYHPAMDKYAPKENQPAVPGMPSPKFTTPAESANAENGEAMNEENRGEANQPRGQEPAEKAKTDQLRRDHGVTGATARGKGSSVRAESVSDKSIGLPAQQTAGENAPLHLTQEHISTPPASSISVQIAPAIVDSTRMNVFDMMPQSGNAPVTALESKSFAPSYGEEVLSGIEIQKLSPDEIEKAIRDGLAHHERGAVGFKKPANAEASPARPMAKDAHSGANYTWSDSMPILGQSLWDAENAYRNAMNQSSSLARQIMSRIYIEDYLQSSDVSDRDLWQDRLEQIKSQEQRLREQWEMEHKGGK